MGTKPSFYAWKICVLVAKFEMQRKMEKQAFLFNARFSILFVRFFRQRYYAAAHAMPKRK